MAMEQQREQRRRHPRPDLCELIRAGTPRQTRRFWTASDDFEHCGACLLIRGFGVRVPGGAPSGLGKSPKFTKLIYGPGLQLGCS